MTFAPEGSKPGQEGIVKTGSRLSRVRLIMGEGRHLMTKHCGLFLLGGKGQTQFLKNE